MGLPHRNDVAVTPAWCPNDDDDFTFHPADRNEPILAVVLPIIQTREVMPGEELICIRKIETANSQGDVPFGAIESDRHEIT